MVAHLNPLSRAQRVVVKIGSALLVDAETGALRRDWLESVAADIAEIVAGGRQAALVSSGAIALGREAQLEVLALVGNYHTISFVAKTAELTPELFAARFPG